MVKGLLFSEKVLLSILTLIAAASIIEYYTGIFFRILVGGVRSVLGDEEGKFSCHRAGWEPSP